MAIADRSSVPPAPLGRHARCSLSAHAARVPCVTGTPNSRTCPSQVPHSRANSAPIHAGAASPGRDGPPGRPMLPPTVPSVLSAPSPGIVLLTPGKRSTLDAASDPCSFLPPRSWSEKRTSPPDSSRAGRGVICISSLLFSGNGFCNAAPVTSVTHSALPPPLFR